MKILDTTRLCRGQLQMLAMLVKAEDDRLYANALGQRVRLSNLDNKTVAHLARSSSRHGRLHPTTDKF